MIRSAFAVLMLVFAISAVADEKSIRRMVEAKMNGARVEGVQPAPMAGLWEVRLRTEDGPRIVYTDAKADYILLGSLYDARADRNLTEERIQKLSAIRFDDLPLANAVTVKRGNGKRVLAIFSDPYCPACQSFEKELIKIDDITVHYFMYPVIRPERADHSRAVWCSPDRAKAWMALALNQKVPSAKPACSNPIDRVLELGRKLGVNSTPTLFFVNGERVRGGMPADRLGAVLNEAGAAPRAAAKKE